MQGVKAIFFDLHGTLVLSHNVDDAWSKWADAFYKRMTSLGMESSKEVFLDKIDGIFESPEPQLHEEGLSLFERRVKQLCIDIGLNLDNKSLREMVDHVITIWHRDMYLDPEAIPVFDSLKDQYKLGLITNWEHTPRISPYLEELGIRHYFDEVVVSDSVGTPKPDPYIFRVALSRVGLEPHEMAYVGDLDVDVEGSRNSGVHPILISREQAKGNWMYNSKMNGTDIEASDKVVLIRRLTDLLDIF